MIHEGLAKVCRKFHEAKLSQEPLKISLLYRCLMADVICEYAFGESFHFLENLPWSEGFFSATETTMKGGWLFRESKLIHSMSMIMMALPEWLFPRKSMKELVEWAKVRIARHYLVEIMRVLYDSQNPARKSCLCSYLLLPLLAISYNSRLLNNTNLLVC